MKMWVAARLREPSSWNSLAFLIGVWAPAFGQYDLAVYVAAGICATIGFVMKEARHAPDPS